MPATLAPGRNAHAGSVLLQVPLPFYLSFSCACSSPDPSLLFSAGSSPFASRPNPRVSPPLPTTALGLEQARCSPGPSHAPLSPPCRPCVMALVRTTTSFSLVRSLASTPRPSLMIPFHHLPDWCKSAYLSISSRKPLFVEHGEQQGKFDHRSE